MNVYDISHYKALLCRPYATKVQISHGSHILLKSVSEIPFVKHILLKNCQTLHQFAKVESIMYLFN